MAVHRDRADWSRRLKSSPVRVQWDPERSLQLAALPYRSLQVRLRGEAVDRYVDEWTVAITDITPTVRRIADLLRAGEHGAAAALLPVERPYPLPGHLRGPIGAGPDTQGPAVAGLPPEVTRLLTGRTDHRQAQRSLQDAGWALCGAGDWAVALRSPDGALAARISPFDPTGPYTAELYRQAAPTRQVPTLFAHARLTGGGDLQVMEWLRPAAEEDATAFLRAIAVRDPRVAELADTVRRIHERARQELPWCGPLDQNPANVMRAADGRLVVTDLFYADGPNLYETAARDPDLVVARIPESERRFMTDIPLAVSGPWQADEQARVRAGLAAADARWARSEPA